MTARIASGIHRGLEEALAIAQGAAEESQVVVHSFERYSLTPRKKGRLMPPLHPGEMLREDFLIPLGMTAKMLAGEIKVPTRHVVAIVEDEAWP